MRTVVLALILSVPVAAADKPLELPLWPGDAPGEKAGAIPAEAYLPDKANEKFPVKRLANVSKPTITVFTPKAELNTGAAVIVVPGGGYNILAFEHEGSMVCEWLNTLGVTGVLLKYRVPRRRDQPKGEPPVSALQDAQRAVSLTRSKAKEWGIDPKRIGMLGFSAGGHLTAWTLSTTDKRAYEPADAIDKVSSRPDFAVLIYPAYLTNREKKMPPELTVTKDTPPCFLAVSYNDDGCFAGTIEYMKALKASKVPAELHVFAGGGHGYGMKPSDQSYATWPKRCGEWLAERGYLKK